METGQIPGAATLSHWTVLEGDKEPVDIRPFELYLVLQVNIDYKLINHGSWISFWLLHGNDDADGDDFAF